MINLQVDELKKAYENRYYKHSTKRESRAKPSISNFTSNNLEKQIEDQNQRVWNNNSIVLDTEDNLGPEYEFIRHGTFNSLDEEIFEPMVTLTDLLTEVATIDQTLENNLLFTQHIHEDNELFDIIYGIEDHNTYGIELFGNLELEFNYPNFESNNNQLINEHENIEQIAYSVINNNQCNNLNENISIEQDQESSDSIVWPDVPEAEGDEDYDFFNEGIKLGPTITNTADQTMVSTNNKAIMIDYNSRYVFTSEINQMIESQTDYIGRKRNLE